MQPGGERAGHLAQAVVAREVAVVVVEFLEEVDVDQHQRKFRALASGPPPLGQERLVETAPVGGPGEAVDGGQALEDRILGLQFAAGGGEVAERRVALLLGQETARVGANPGDQLDAIGQLHHIVDGAAFEGMALVARILLRRQHDDRDRRRRRVLAEALHHREAVDAGHDEVLQNGGRADRLGGGQRRFRIPAVVERHVGLIRQHCAHRRRDDHLVIDQEHDWTR
jgi:hypothetical protein